MKIAILGAGISGISLYDILNKQYGIQCDIYEKENKIGGLCKTEVVNDYVYDLSGGHVFNSKYEDVKEYVFDLIPKEKWTYSRRLSNIIYDKNTIVDYPFEFSLSKLPVEVAVECIEGLYRRNDDNNITNFKDFLLNTFGEGIYEHYLRPYNEKIWKRNLDKLDYNWVNGKMPYPKAKEILSRTLSNETNETGMVHSFYYYPNEGGIQSLIDKMGENIQNEHIGEKILEIRFIDNKVIINGNTYDFVINTVPLPEIVDKIIDIDKIVKNSIEELQYNSVLSYIFEVDKENDWSWTYIPDNKIIPHRIVYQGNLAKGNCPEGKSSITAEITQPHLYKEDEILENIKNKLGLINPISKHFTKYAYVVFDIDRGKNISTIKKYMNKNNIILHGRFAEWTYPNMDICIKNSIDLAKSINDLVYEK